MRPSGRTPDEIRPISFIRHFTNYAEGSVLVAMGNTKVLCNASVIEGVPRFLRDAQQGWLTAEYGMLPRSTHDRINREAVKGKQGGRTVEIQRLIGRALRAAVDLTILDNYTITVDCDVIQADGGTRTAAINGAYIAIVDAIQNMLATKIIKKNPIKHGIAAVSVGIYANTAVVDLDYAEDSNAHTDMNVVMTDTGAFVEIQGTAEGEAFSNEQLTTMLSLSQSATEKIIQQQQIALQQ